MEIAFLVLILNIIIVVVGVYLSLCHGLLWLQRLIYFEVLEHIKRLLYGYMSVSVDV